MNAFRTDNKTITVKCISSTIMDTKWWGVRYMFHFWHCVTSFQLEIKEAHHIAKWENPVLNKQLDLTVWIEFNLYQSVFLLFFFFFSFTLCSIVTSTLDNIFTDSSLFNVFYSFPFRFLLFYYFYWFVFSLRSVQLVSILYTIARVTENISVQQLCRFIKFNTSN